MPNRASPILALLSLFAAGCAESPITIPMHNPIYPAVGQGVIYTLEKVSGSRITRVQLYEKVSAVDASGAVTSSGAQTLLRTWRSPGSTIEFSKSEGYPANSLVRYRFVVRARSGLWPRTETYNHEVAFATRPNPADNPDDLPQGSDPVNAMPAPVYVVGDPDAAFDVVLIPDTDIPDDHMEMFRDHCRGVIRDAFLDEPTLRVFRRSFNFYINPSRGEATGYEQARSGVLHKIPVNFASLSFAEGRILMHEQTLWDYAVRDLRLCSTEMQNRGTILHESGHILFELADEYENGAHWEATPLPNNWRLKTDAESDAPRRGKSASDTRQISDSPPWWKLCDDSCQMKTADTQHTAFDRPCHDRVVSCVLENARP